MIFSFLQVKTEPPVELNVDITSLPSLPDPSILPNNPLIPKAFFGFENMNTFEPLKAPTPMPKPQPTPKPNKPEKSEPIVEKVKAVKVESHHEEPLFQPPVKSIPDKKSSNTTDKESSDKKKEKKKEKALKKAKKVNIVKEFVANSTKICFWISIIVSTNFLMAKIQFD